MNSLKFIKFKRYNGIIFKFLVMVKCFNIRENSIKAEGAKAIADSLKFLKEIRKLNLNF